MAAPVETMVLKDDPEVPVAGVALGLGAWLAEPSRWAAEGAARLLAELLAVAPDTPLWMRTSLLSDWRPVASPRARQELLDAVPASWTQGRPRHFFTLEVADDPGVPAFGFRYTEVDPARAARPSAVELTLPQATDPGKLLALARRLPELGPFLVAVGGHAARWNPAHDRLAFAQIRVWCKRYLGLDVQALEEMAWRIPDGLPGTSWLTLLGPALADRLKLDLDALAHGWSADVEATPVAGGLLLRAGAAPTLGDVNRGEFPAAYAEVARRLAPAFVKEPPPFRGGFGSHEGTVAWLRRLVEPEAWE